MARLRARITYANVVASLALFISLGGGAYAATNLPKNSVGSPQIKDGSVRGADLANNAVTSAKVKDGSLLSADFKAGQLHAGAQGRTGAQGSVGPQGPTGSQGPVGPKGPAGPATGPAGGDLTGSYPNPTIAPGSVGAGKLATLPMARMVLDPQVVTGAPLTGTEVADTAGMHSDTTNPSRITAPVGGTYIITAGARWSNSLEDHLLNIVKNGSQYLASSAEAGTSTYLAQNTVATVVRLAAGDYVELFATAAGGTGRQISPFEEQSNFSVAFIGP
ncbi:MAG: hypothetical protein QOG59_1078 [Solirubrobacteraceae bacterium]|nr:hypothetical protein [Solirubrobacteraceae bacterium]